MEPKSKRSLQDVVETKHTLFGSICCVNLSHMDEHIVSQS